MHIAGTTPQNDIIKIFDHTVTLSFGF